MLLDFKNSLTVKAWLQTIKNKEKIILKEFLFDPETPIQDKEGGKYMNEFIASVINKKPSFINNTISPIKKLKPIRSFAPGSEWLYIKYYCGSKTADIILKKAIRPFVNSLRNKKLIQKWFFVRCADPDNHIRLRLHLNGINNLDEILKMNLHYIKPFERNQQIWKIQFDTYYRETERYTNASIEDSEEIFYYDSECVLNFIAKTPGTLRNNYFWLWAIKGIDELLKDFNITLEEKTHLLRELKEDYYKEFNVDKPVKHQIDAKFRKSRTVVETVLKGIHQDEVSDIPFHLFNIRSRKIKPIALRISSTHKPEIKNDLVKSYIHMFLNRTFPHSQRIQEMIVYDFLYI